MSSLILILKKCKFFQEIFFRKKSSEAFRSQSCSIYVFKLYPFTQKHSNGFKFGSFKFLLITIKISFQIKNTLWEQKCTQILALQCLGAQGSFLGPFMGYNSFFGEIRLLESKSILLRYQPTISQKELKAVHNLQRMLLNIDLIFLPLCSIKEKQEIVRGEGEINDEGSLQKVYKQQKTAKKYVTDIYGELLSDMYDFELKLVITSKGFQASNLLIQRKIMSQDIAKENNQPPYPPSDATVAPPEPNGVLPLEARIVEVTKQKKKIQVIEINDSEEKEVKPAKSAKTKERKALPQGSKPKKMIIRCMLCKEAGKKATMKACLDCKLFTHISCLEQQGEQVLRYLCRKCKHKREENLLSRKGEKGGDQKLTVRRLEKEKRKQEQQKKLGEFQERYPYYFQEDKVRFPIEDKLLFIYKELFDITETPKLKPIPHPLIPAHQLADFLQIQNFFSTFREELVGFGTLPSEIKKNIFYVSMGSNEYDGVYCCLLESLLNIYLSDIFDKNKTDNVRILNDHPFFTLLIHLNDNQELNQQVLVKAAKEIMRYLATIPSMKKAFEDLQYPTNIDLQSKTKLIVGLIRGLSEIDEFHDLVSIKSQKMQQLTKQKTELIAQLKIDQAENLSNNQKLKGMNLQSKELELSQEGVTRQLTKELDKHKKKMQKLASQQTKSEETIKQIRNKIAEIGRAMPFITSQMYYLGKDRNDSQYFFFMRQPNRIYVKSRSYLMDDNQHFYMYEGKETILELVKGFNVKGIKQRHLCENIQALIKDQVITNNISVQEESGMMLQEQKYTDITILDVLNMIKETEQTFTTYLTVKEYQWASVSVREMFMQQLMTITDLQILKENLRSLQENFLFAEYMNTYNVQTPMKRDDQSDDDLRMQAKEGRKKVPIRIWGINSEKTKKYWVQYLQECIDVVGIWVCAYIFKNNVDKYVKKKMETYYQMQMKEKKLKKTQTYQRGRPPARKQESEKNQKSENIEVSQNNSEEVIESRRPNLRARKQKKMNIDSEIDNEPEQEEANESSSNEDCCEICGEYGEMICCDTCPKVYHVECLKMKDIPQGEWSCVKCLQKLSNQRQTRSRVKKMGKFM